MTARKQCYLTIYVLHRHRGYCFGCFSSYFLLFVTFGPTSPASQYIYNTVSGHSHTLDMAIHKNSIRDSRLGRDVTSIVAALHASWHVARPSARGMCSMNTSSCNRVPRSMQQRPCTTCQPAEQEGAGGLQGHMVDTFPGLTWVQSCE